MNFFLIFGIVIAVLAIIAGFIGQSIGAAALSLIALAAIVIGLAIRLARSGSNPFR